MYRALIISLLVLIYGCAAQDGKYIQVIKPQGVPMCSAPTEFPGYHSWRVEAPNVAVVKLFPFHANDMMYKVIGPNAERRMLLSEIEGSLNKDLIKTFGDQDLSGFLRKIS